MTTKSSRLRRMSGRTLLILMLAVLPCAWGGLLLFTRYVPPQNVSAFVVFFVLLSIALLCTFAPLTYFITLAMFASRSRRPRIPQAIRQGGLISAWLVFNLLLRSLHSWSIFTTIVSFGIIVVIEVMVLGRK